MATTTFFLAFILIFLFSSTAIFAQNEVVKDVQGNALRIGVSYLIAQRIYSRDVSLTQIVANGTCSVNVIQELTNDIEGSPFTLEPVTGQDIRVNTKLVIQSPESPDACFESTIWKLSSNVALNVPVIKSGGFANTPNSCFRIAKSRQSANTYNFEHCPALCGGEGNTCSRIGIYTEGDIQYLSTGVAPLEFTFRRASTPNKSIIEI